MDNRQLRQLIEEEKEKNELMRELSQIRGSAKVLEESQIETEAEALIRLDRNHEIESLKEQLTLERVKEYVKNKRRFNRYRDKILGSSGTPQLPEPAEGEPVIYEMKNKE